MKAAAEFDATPRFEQMILEQLRQSGSFRLRRRLGRGVKPIFVEPDRRLGSDFPLDQLLFEMMRQSFVDYEILASRRRTAQFHGAVSKAHVAVPLGLRRWRRHNFGAELA